MKLLVCKEVASFDVSTAQKLKNIVDKEYHFESKSKTERYKDEISGKLELKEIDGRYVLLLDSIKEGNGDESDFINKPYTFHTHPTEAYTQYNCDLGWPSSDDYIAFLDGFLNMKCIFHCVITLEGIYIICMDPQFVQKLCNVHKKKGSKDRERIMEDLEEYIKKYGDIDKTNFKITTGVYVRGYGQIKTVEDYVNYTNNMPLFKNKFFKKGIRIVHLRFIPWSRLIVPSTKTTFEFYFPPDAKGECHVK